MFQSNSKVLTTAKTPGHGNINITLGVFSNKVSTKVPKNVIVDEQGGDVEFRGKSLKAVGPVNKLTALGADVIISNSVNAKNLTLGGGVTITADPPVPVGTPRVVIHGGTRNSGSSQSALVIPVSTAPSDVVLMPTTELPPQNDYVTIISSQIGSLAYRSTLAPLAPSLEVDLSEHASGKLRVMKKYKTIKNTGL